VERPYTIPQCADLSTAVQGVQAQQLSRTIQNSIPKEFMVRNN